MPGRVVSLSVDVGQRVERGDPLLAIEAIKIESTVFADEAGTVGELLVEPGAEVETKDLSLVLGRDADAAHQTAEDGS